MALWAETGAAVGAAHFTLTQPGDAMVEGSSLSKSNEARLSHAGGSVACCQCDFSVLGQAS